MLKVFIGFDPKETLPFHVLANSIRRHSSKPIAVIPIDIRNLKEFFNRPISSNQSNEFSITRFLVPYLSDFDGISVFMDCDMLVRFDMNQLLTLDFDDYDLALVKHDYTPRRSVKYLGAVQEAYPKKNWSSFVVWNCASKSARHLTLEYVLEASPKQLHRFEHIPEEKIYDLGIDYNFLVEEYDSQDKKPKVIHWTNGGPYFNDFKDADFAEEWLLEMELTTHVKQWE